MIADIITIINIIKYQWGNCSNSIHKYWLVITDHYKKLQNTQKLCEIISHSDDTHAFFHFIKHIHVCTILWTYTTVYTSESLKTKLGNL